MVISRLSLSSIQQPLVLVMLLLMGIFVGITIVTLPFVFLFTPFLVCIVTLITFRRERNALSGLVFLLLLVFIYRTVFFHYYENEIESDLYVEYLRRVELNLLPIVEYPLPEPLFEAQPLSYLSLHYLSTLCGMPAPLAAKLLRVLWGLIDTILIFSIAYTLTRSKRCSLLAATLFTTSFIEFWDLAATQFKQISGQTFWYVFLALFLQAFSSGLLIKPRIWIGLSLSFIGAILGHKLFLFMIPILIIIPTLVTVAIGRYANRFSWVIILMIISFLIPMAMAFILLSPTVWDLLWFPKAAVLFAGIQTPERLVQIGPIAWLGQLLAFASSVVVLLTILNIRRLPNQDRVTWYLAGAIAMVGLSFNATYYFGIPIEGGRAMQLIWPLICIFLAYIIFLTLRKLPSQAILFIPTLTVVILMWIFGNLWNVVIDPESTSIEVTMRSNPPELIELIYGPVFQQRGFLVEVGIIFIVLASLHLIGQPFVRYLATVFPRKEGMFNVFQWTASLWGLFFLVITGTVSLVAVRVELLPSNLALSIGVVAAALASLHLQIWLVIKSVTKKPQFVDHLPEVYHA